MSAAAFVGLALWVRFGPLPDAVLHPAFGDTPVLTDRLGRPLSPARSVSIADHAGAPPLAHRAERLAAATLVAEDQRFYGHLGVDPLALGRVVLANAKRGSFAQGGSTITQQLVKLRLQATRRTLSEKARETVYALQLERRLSKTEILSAYLAEAPYGGRVVGAEAAARLYFQTPVSQLSWAQAAFLAALPQRPTAYNPIADPLAARTRQRWILRRLRETGAITTREERAAAGAPLRVGANAMSPAVRDSGSQGIAPHFSEMVAAQLRPGAPLARLAAANGANRASDGVVRTTLDGGLQADVAGIARHHRELLRKKGAANVAIVVLEHGTGALRAWEGSGGYLDWDHGGMLNGPLVPRQTGSTIKPFIYALAFEHGAAPGDVVDDRPVVYEWGGDSFRPENYDHRFRGELSMRTALGSSINVPAVKLLRAYGAAGLADLLARFDLNTPRPTSTYGLSLALGTAEIDLLSLTRAYAAFAAGGTVPPVRVVEGGPPTKPAGTEPAVSAETAYLVSDVLRDNEARAPAFGRRSALVFDFPVAAKTGTSQDFHDNWVVGSTDRFTVGVWVGNFDRLPLREGASGVTGAGPIFHAVMRAAQTRLGSGTADVPAAPPGLRRVAVCEPPSCATSRWDYAWAVPAPRSGAPPRGGQLRTPGPSPVLSRAEPSPVDHPTSGAGRASGPTATAADSSRADSSRADSSRAASGRHEGGAGSGTRLPLSLVRPAVGAHYVIDPTVPTEFQELGFEAAGGVGPYSFTVNGRPLRPHTLEGRADTAMLWRLQPGTHRACAIDATDETRCVSFRVSANAPPPPEAG